MTITTSPVATADVVASSIQFSGVPHVRGNRMYGDLYALQVSTPSLLHTATFTGTLADLQEMEWAIHTQIAELVAAAKDS